MENKINFFRLDFNEEALEFTELAVTNNPAIGITDGVMLNQIKEEDFIQLDDLIELNSDKQIIASVALVADKWIERFDTKTKETNFITFSPDQVVKFKEAFEKNGGIVNIDHTDRKVKAKIILSEIVGEVSEEKIREEFDYKGKLNKTDYFVALYIENKEDWEYMKENGMNSFSIQAYFNKNYIKFNKINKQDMENEELLAKLAQLEAKLAEYEKEKEVEVEAEVEEQPKEVEVEAEVETENEESFVFTEEMYNDLIEKIAELMSKMDTESDSQEDEIVEMNDKSNKKEDKLINFYKGLVK
jgi:hypothetical protein